MTLTTRPTHATKGRWLIRALLALCTGLLLAIPPHPTRASTPPVPIRLVEATSQGVTVAFTLPAYTLRAVSAGDQTYTEVHAPRLALGAEPGAPQLPQTGALIGLPPASRATVHVLESEQATISLEHPVQPAPVPIPGHTEVTDGSSPRMPAYTVRADETIYARDVAYPSDPVALAELGQVRGHRVAGVTFFPFRYNPARRELAVTQRLLVEIRFSQEEQESLSSPDLTEAGDGDTAFDALLDRALLNADLARGWQVARDLGAQASAAWANPPAMQPGSFEVVVDRDGLYRLTYAKLQDAGLPVDSLDPATFQLFEQGQEVDITVWGSADGRFDPGDSIVFYGRVPRSRYVAHNVYWLRHGDAAGARMAARNVAAGGQAAGQAWTRKRYEQNLLYGHTYPTADGDHWYADKLLPLEGKDRTATLSLMPLDMGVPTATLRIAMVGFASTNRTTFEVNGQPVGELTWSGHSPVTATKTVDRALLRAGGNLVHVVAHRFLQETWLDAIEIDYAVQAVRADKAVFWGQAGLRQYTLDGFTSGDVRLYDVSDPRHPVRLEGGTGGGGRPLHSPTPRRRPRPTWP